MILHTLPFAAAGRHQSLLVKSCPPRRPARPFPARLEHVGLLTVFVILLFASAARPAAAQGGAPFVDSGQDLGTSQSYSLALGDVDGDGDLDAFVANYAEANKVWLNDGTGVFTATAQDMGSANSTAVGLGDLNGDGDLDAFVVNHSQPNKVWLNDGTGVFTATPSNMGIFASTDVALGDLDGDGDLDAFIANYGQGNRVWLNDGAGTFTSTNQSLGFSASLGAVLGDVDGDGDLDALIANDAPQAANKVWLNDGHGIFSATLQNLGNSASSDIALGDLDGDGDLDAFVANDTGLPNAVWLNDGNGTFTATLQNLGNGASTAVELQDVDHDGDLDAFVANDAQPNAVWLNDGNGTFTATLQNLGNSASKDVALGDLDRDGDLDAFVVNYADGNRIWLNVMIHRNALLVNSGQALGHSMCTGVALEDLDRDGDLDMFLVNYNQANTVLLNNGTGRFTTGTQIISISPSEGVAMGDFDGDGDSDAFEVNFFAPNTVWLNDGTGAFTTNSQMLGNAGSFGVAVGDVDGDGDLDAFVSNFGEPNTVWLNDGTGTFSDSGQTLGGSDSYSVALGDLDGDGDLDAFVTNYGQPNHVWRNDGAGIFLDSGQALGTSFSLGVALGDMDKDGDLDAFVANTHEANTVWWNDGAGTFSDSGQRLGVDKTYSLALGDVDHDGDLDAFTANYFEAKKVWLNDGTGTFTLGAELTPSDGLRAALGDLDRDGDLDAFAGNYGIVQANEVWLNRGGQFSLPTTNTAPSAIPQGEADDLLNVRVVHNGRTGDTAVELATLDLLFEASPGDPLTSAAADALIESVRVYLDNDSGVFEPTSDTLVASVTTPTLSNGVLTVPFTDDDPNVVTALDRPTTYFVVVELTADAALHSPNQFQVTHLTESSSTAEDRDHDIPLLMAYTPNTVSGLVVIDGGYPSVHSITRLSPSPTRTTTVTLAVQFSEAVSGFDLTDCALVTTGVTGGAVGAVSGGPTSYTVTVQLGTGDGEVRLDVVDDNSIVDIWGFPLGGVETGDGDFTGGEVYVVDNTPPIPVISSVTTDPTNASTIPVTVSFSEVVTGLEVSDVVCSNATASNLSGSGAIYTLDLTPSGEGLVTADIPAAVAQDLAGNDNVAAGQFQRTYDGLPPSVLSVTRLDPHPTNAFSVRFRVAFNEDVTGVDRNDFLLWATGLSAIAITDVAGSHDTYQVIASAGYGDGAIRLDVFDNDSIRDNAGNPLGGVGIANGNFIDGESYLVDKTAPQTHVTGPNGYLWSISPVIPVTFTVHETGSGFRGVSLYYRKDHDPAGFLRYGDEFTSTPISFDTRTTGNDGTYEFYTIGIDNVGNFEDAPARPDATVDFNVKTGARNWIRYQ